MEDKKLRLSSIGAALAKGEADIHSGWENGALYA